MTSLKDAKRKLAAAARDAGPPGDFLRRAVRAFCPTGEGGGIDNSCSPSGGGGRIQWTGDPGENLWLWTDARGEAPIKPLDELIATKPLAVVTDGDFEKWITFGVNDQNAQDRIQRAGTMFVRNKPTGLTLTAGAWMDLPEGGFDDGVFDKYARMPREQRAAQELEYQKAYGMEKEFNFRLGLFQKGDPEEKAWVIRGSEARAVSPSDGSYVGDPIPVPY